MAAELRARDGLGSFLNDLGLTGTGVEVGVYRGDFSQILLSQWQGKHWYMVDRWDLSEDFLIRHGGINWEMEEAYQAAQQTAAGDSRATIVKMTQEMPEATLPTSVDAVYLDLGHDTASVLQDVRNWWPKIRPGGILAGHDYVDQWYWTNRINHGVLFGVKSAVDHFAADQQRIVSTTNEQFPTWWIRKPIGKPVSIGVVSATTIDLPWREISQRNHRRYCERHNYQYFHHTLESGPTPPAWHKPSLVRTCLETCDWAMWIDADALFMDSTTKLERFWDGCSPFIWMKDEKNGLNTGVFFARRCPETLEFLDRWEAMSRDPEWRDHKWWENGAAIELEQRGELPGLVMPHRVANSYPHLPGEWGPEDFIFHCAGLVPPVRNALLEDLALRADLAFDRLN